MPNVSVTVCDDIRLEANGKLILIGVYTGNIVIPADDYVTPQISFFFHIDIPRDTHPTKVMCEIGLPGGSPPQRGEIAIAQPAFKEGHTRWVMRHVLGFRNAPLIPGKIEARVYIDDEVYPAVAAWVEKVAMFPGATPIDPTVSPPPPAQSPRGARAKVKKP
jgi:hypothetical protein